MNITQEKLKDIFHYSPETGLFTRLVATSPNVKVGQVSKRNTTKGYIQIRINTTQYKAHRLAYLYMTGKFNDDEIDHVNGIRDDNRWCNLRNASRSENMQNKKVHSNNAAGITGVSWNKMAGKWLAYINKDKSRTIIGYYDTIFDAACARISMQENMFGEFAYRGKN